MIGLIGEIELNKEENGIGMGIGIENIYITVHSYARFFQQPLAARQPA